MAACKTAASCLRQRAQLILGAFAGRLNLEIAKDLGLDRQQVGRWRRRWRDAWRDLTVAECQEPPARFRARLHELLSDLPRPGAPPQYGPEVRAQVVALACIAPKDCGRPIEHWTARELAAEHCQRHGVKLSATTVRRFLDEAELQPHRSPYWMRSRPQPGDEQKVTDICDAYAAAPAQHVRGARTVCIDEKTSMQALEHAPVAPARPATPAAEGQPAQPGLPRRQEFEYKRHGTLCLTANHEVATGTALASTLAATRTEADFVKHVRRLAAADPQAEWTMVMDQLNTHSSASLVRWVAKACGLADELGKKGRAEF